MAAFPQALDYMKEILDNQDKFAFFHLKYKPGNLGKRSSSHAEQNHASIVAFIEKETSNLDLCQRIQELLKRQNELSRKHNAGDRKHLMDVQNKHSDNPSHPSLSLSKHSYVGNFAVKKRGRD